MSNVTVTNTSDINIVLPGSMGSLLSHETRTYTDLTVAGLEAVSHGLIALQTAGKITFDVFTNSPLTAAEAETSFSTNEDVAARAKLVSEEFVDAPVAVTDYFVAATAGAVTAQVITTFAANGLTIPRNITITRSASVGAYTLAPIVVVGKVNGETVTLTFTPATADGGDVLASAELVGLLTLDSVSIPDQVSALGSFTVGFGVAIGLENVIVVRAGLANVVRQVAIGAVVTTGTVVGRLYTPAAAPNATNDYYLLYEAV